MDSSLKRGPDRQGPSCSRLPDAETAPTEPGPLGDRIRHGAASIINRPPDRATSLPIQTDPETRRTPPHFSTMRGQSGPGAGPVPDESPRLPRFRSRRLAAAPLAGPEVSRSRPGRIIFPVARPR
jgi:hypothetical protein